MKIWVDICNSPHVNFFSGLIREMSAAHEFVITCRALANTIDLLEMHKLSFHVVGRHYGKNSVNKLLGFSVRVAELMRFVRRHDIDVAICHSSYYLPVAAKLAGVPSIYLNDNEFAQGNRVAFVFANRIMVPEYFKDSALARQWARPGKVTRYPGVKEGVYLWQHGGQPNVEARAPARPLIIVRPEPWYAQYYRGRRNFLDDLLAGLARDYRLLLLPRDAEQAEHYRRLAIRGLDVAVAPISLAAFRTTCDLFIGAGGTMTREAAVLGIPTISVYQDELLAVDEYLVDSGAMLHQRELNAAFVRSWLETTRKQPPRAELLAKGRRAYDLMKEILLATSKAPVLAEHRAPLA